LLIFTSLCHIFTAHGQKQLFMNFRWKFWHRCSIPWPRFPYWERYFGDLRTFSVDYCIGYAGCPPYFHFRSSWPIDLECVRRCVLHDENFHQVWSWYDHPLRSYSVPAVDTLHDLWPWPFTFWPWSVVIHGGYVFNPSTMFEDIWLSVLELWAVTSPIGYLWQCICSHCACAISRNLWVWGKFSPHIWNLWPAICLFTIQLGVTMSFKGCLLLASLMLKLFSADNF